MNKEDIKILMKNFSYGNIKVNYLEILEAAKGKVRFN
jgi:hypothetical protein